MKCFKAFFAAGAALILSVAPGLAQVGVVRVSATNEDGLYTNGAVISVHLTYNQPVGVNTNGGTPTLELKLFGSATNAFAVYDSGTGSSNLYFNYTVARGHRTADAANPFTNRLEYTSTNALALNGGAITDSFGSATALGLPEMGSADSLSGQKNIEIRTPPIIMNVTSPNPNAFYSTGDVITINLHFSDIVVKNGAGTPLLELATAGASNAFAPFTSGSGSTNLIFTYTVGAGQHSADLDYASTNALTTPSCEIIRTNDPSFRADLSLPTPAAAGSLSANKDLIIDTPAVVANVAATNADGAYGLDSIIGIELQFSCDVTNMAVASLQLAVGGSSNVYAYCPAGAWGSNLLFTYNVGPGQNSTNLDYVNTNSLSGQLSKVDGTITTNVVLALPPPGAPRSLGANSHISIDTTVPQLADFDPPAGTAGVATNYTLRVIFSENVYKGTEGNVDIYYRTNSALFESIPIGDARISISSNVASITHNNPFSSSAEISYYVTISNTCFRDAVSNYCVGIPAGDTNRWWFTSLDSVLPSVTNVTSTTPDGTYTTGTVINVRVQFNEPIQYSRQPRITLETGGFDRNALATNSTANYIDFAYQVGAGDVTLDLDYVSQFALTNSPGGWIRDFASNNAVLTLPTPGAAGSLGANKAIVIDTIAPTVRNVTSPNPDGYYAQGAIIDVHVQFSEPVNVNTAGGTPRLRLNSGASVYANFAAVVNGTNAVFTYTVAAGDNSPDLDYTSAGALELNGGTIADPAGNPAAVALAAPGAAGSLGANKSLVIDTTAPTVTVSSDSTSPTNGSPMVFYATFSETVVNFLSGSIQILNGTLVPTNFPAQGSLFTFYVAPTGAGATTNVLVSVRVPAGVTQDLAGNPNAASTPTPYFTRLYDTVRPTVSMTSTSDNPTGVSPIPVRAVFSENVTGFTAASIRTLNALVADFAGSGSNYTFNLVPTMVGIVRANIDDGVCTDLAGNPNYASTAFVREYFFAAPGNIQASDGTYADYVRVTWTPPPGAVSFRIWRCTQNNTALAAIIGVSATTAYNDTTAVAGSVYYYWVQAINGGGAESSLSGSDSGWRALSPPSNIIASQGTYRNKVRITWTDAPGATIYEIWRNTAASLDGATLLATPTTSPYDDENVEGRVYYYWMRSLNSLGASAFSAPVAGWKVLYPDALNNTFLDWETGGDAEWFAQSDVTHDGESAAQSGHINHNQNSWLRAMVYGPAYLGFWWKASSETNWDFLTFHIDSMEMGRLSGETEWLYQSFIIPEGPHLIQWTYCKDYTRSENRDAGFVDEVAFVEIPRGVAATKGVFYDLVRVYWFGSFIPGTTYEVRRSTINNSAAASVIGVTSLAYFDDTTAAPGRVYYYWVLARSETGATALSDGVAGHRKAKALDFNGDGASDLAVYNPASGEWYVATADGRNVVFGMSVNNAGEKSAQTPVPADYDGDGKADMAVYTSDGVWFNRSAASGQSVVWDVNWGWNGPVAALPADYGGDGRADLAVFDWQSGTWYIKTLDDELLAWAVAWGWNGAVPVPADYDGDGRADLAVFDTRSGLWYVMSLNGGVVAWELAWGWNGAVPVPADYDGDGRTDYGVYNPLTARWYVLGASGNVLFWDFWWGFPGAIPLAMDYDGDNRADFAAYSPADGKWYIALQTGAAVFGFPWGGGGALPLQR